MDSLFRTGIGFPWANRVRACVSKKTTFFTQLIALGCVLAMPASLLAAQPLPEYKVKGALLYKFAKFVTWPNDAFAEKAGQLGICVIGENPFGSFLDSLNGRQLREHKVAVKYFQATDEIGTACHITYIAASEESSVQKILKSLQYQPILTISDIDRFAHLGGVIALARKDKKIKFEINRGSAKQAGIKISSQLLSLATVIESN